MSRSSVVAAFVFLDGRGVASRLWEGRLHMPQRALVLSVFVAAALAVGAVGPVDGDPSSCATQVNDTPSKLLPCITESDLSNHMENFWAIAQQHPGADGHPSRNSGEPGYKASVDYVASLMTAAGYNVTIQTYTFTYFAFTAPPVFAEVTPNPRKLEPAQDWNPGQSSGAANGVALQPAGGIIIPPAPGASSSSGCTSADFSGFVVGRIALIQRGGCNFGVKVINAQAAGASGVIIFNQGDPGRSGLISGGLVDASGNPIIPTIPVAFTSFDIGSDLYDQYQNAPQAPPVMNLAIQAIVTPNAPDYNVIAESPGGDPNHVVVVDAHLDALYGAGMLDNASGSATVLEIAQMMQNVTPLNKLRFIWFGGEELGLLGSSYYVNNLSPDDLNHIAYDLDADVTATPNYLIGILDPGGADPYERGTNTAPAQPNAVPERSTVARDEAVSYLNSLGLNHVFISPTGTDAYNFNMKGIPASGVLTGQDCCKSQDEVNLFGGSVGNFEGNLGTSDGGCVDNPFRWCDNLSNNDPKVLTFMSRTFADMVLKMAFDSG